MYLDRYGHLTVYVPYERVLVIGGRKGGKGNPLECTENCFTFYPRDRRVEPMKYMKHGRYGFASHYIYGDRFIYIISGQYQ